MPTDRGLTTARKKSRMEVVPAEGKALHASLLASDLEDSISSASGANHSHGEAIMADAVPGTHDASTGHASGAHAKGLTHGCSSHRCCLYLSRLCKQSAAQANPEHICQRFCSRPSVAFRKWLVGSTFCEGK